MLFVELIGLLCLGKFAHLKPTNSETALVDCVNDLTGLSVTVRFHHGKGAPSRVLESFLGENVCVVN